MQGKLASLRLFFIFLLMLQIFCFVPVAAQASNWAKTYGGASGDYVYSIRQTSDGGFIAAGYTFSFGAGNKDVWIMKLDADGNVTWEKTYGETNIETVYSIQQTSDGGFIAAGYTSSFGAVNDDVWIMKLDADGNVTWEKIYGGANYDYAYSIQQTSDGGFIAAGYTSSFGAGSADVWIMKLDGSGNVSWQKTYGGTDYDYARSIQQTSDGGFIAAGYTSSFGAGSADVWIMKLDGSGNVSWQKTYGGTDDEYSYSIWETSDGGFIAAGYTRSFGAGSDDVWIVKLDEDGNVTWENTYGGGSGDYAYSVQQTSDSGFIAAGTTSSFGAGSYDFRILKLNEDGYISDRCSDVYLPSAATVNNTSAIVSNTAVTGADSSATVQTSDADIGNTTADANTQCFFAYVRGDLDGDGLSDLLWRHASTGQIWGWLMNGLGITDFGAIATSSQSDWQIAGKGDFDGGGRTDILWSKSSDGTVGLWLMDGLSIAEYGTVLSLSDSDWVIKGVGDFDGNGKCDILWQHNSYGVIYIWLMDGFQIVEYGYVATVSDTSWEVVALADFNGDNKADALWRNNATGQVYLWLMDGTNITNHGAVATVSDSNWQIDQVGNFNDDKKADILWRHATSGTVYLWTMDGLEITDEGSYGMISDLDWEIIASLDCDGDGRSEICWRHADSGMIYMWLVNGLEIIDEGSVIMTSDTSWQIVQ